VSHNKCGYSTTVPAAVIPGDFLILTWLSSIYHCFLIWWEGIKSRDKSENLPMIKDFAACGERDAYQTMIIFTSLTSSAAKS